VKGILYTTLLQASSKFHPQVMPDHDSNGWITLVLMGSFTALVLLHVFDRRRLFQLMNGVFRQGSVSMLYREESTITSRVSILLLINYILMASLFLWQSGSFFGAQFDHAGQFGIIALSLILIYLIKITMTRMLGSIFGIRESAVEYVYNIILFNKTTGLILFPVSLMLAFAWQVSRDVLVWTGIVSILLMLIYRTLRLILIGMGTSTVSFFYIILYLCTLEILPFLILFKILGVLFQN
jgi:Domain of unknown function (DUF4271)